MTQSKIQGKFYPLTPKLAKKLREAKLTAAEWRFWAYLVEIDPYGDRYHDLSPVTIQAECEMSKPTYYRAKAKFQELDLLDFQEEKGSSRNLTGISKMKLESQKRDSQSQKRDSQSQKRDSQSQKRENQRPEAAPSNDSSAPQTIKTYSDFIKTLSEGERENFFEFGLKKATELPKPPTLPEKWVEKHHQELYEQFKQTPEGQTLAPSQDWANHPKRDEWIELIREGKGSFIVNGGPKSEKQTRMQFAQWACDNKLVWRVEP